jgi:hypothetical protein
VKPRSAIRVRRGERGYALLLVAFAATLMLIVAMTAAPRVITDGKREREKEMIWRGKQYVRGIKMYYRKTGKYPTSLEDLTKPQLGNIHFMRQAYKDPMNKDDGSWRLLYVGPNGQLIGSLKPQPASGMSTTIPGTVNIGTPAANMNGTSIGTTGLSGAPSDPGAAQNAGAAPADAGGISASMNSTQTSPIFGGNIVGVGSKAVGPSVIVYEKATDYHLFEFYWDQTKDSIQFGGQPNIPGTSTPGTPAGMQPGAPVNPGAPAGGTNPPGGLNPIGPPTQDNPPQN